MDSVLPILLDTDTGTTAPFSAISGEVMMMSLLSVAAAPPNAFTVSCNVLVSNAALFHSAAKVFPDLKSPADAASAMTRDELVRQTAYGLGYRRTGSRIADALDDAIRTAVRRGFVERAEDQLKLYRSPIDTWDRDWLKREFLAAIGRPWLEREDAIRAFSRWLGYRRTSSLFDETARSLINGLLREGRLEANANFVRRVA